MITKYNRNSAPRTAVSQANGATISKNPLAKAIVSNPNPSRIATQMGQLGNGGDTVVYTITNGGGATAGYIIGDAYGAVEAALGVSLADPTSVDAFSVAALKSLYGTNPVQITGMNLQTSSDARQFAQTYQYVTVENDGSSTTKKLRLAQFASPSDYNALIRPVDLTNLPGGVVLGAKSGLVIYVLAGETLTISMVMGNQTV